MEGKQGRCVVCGEDEGSQISDKQKKGLTLLENYAKCLDPHFQLGGNEESGNELMACDGCSYKINSVINEVERMEEGKKEVSKLEKTLHNKLRELKSTGQCVLLKLGLIRDLMGDRNKDSNLVQKEVYLNNVMETASKGIRDTLGKVGEKQTFVKKWACGEETIAGSSTDPERPVRITSVTSLATNANTNDGFEESEVFQVKTEPEDLSNTVPCPTPDAPVLEKVVKLEKERIRKTRRGVIHRTRVVSAQLDEVRLVNTTADNQVLEPEVIEVEDDDNETEVPLTVPLASASTSTSHPNQNHASEKASTKKRDIAESERIANEEELGPRRKSRRIAESILTKNAENEEDMFQRKWVSEVVSLLVLINPQKVKELKNRLAAIPNLSSELFHELVVALKDANQIKLLLADRNNKRGLHEIIEKIPEVDERTLDILSEAKVNFNILDGFKQNVLHTAIKQNRDVSLLKSLIKRGANVKQVDSNGRNLIHFGVSSGCTPEVLEFLISEVVDINADDKTGNRPLSLLRQIKTLKRKFGLFKVLVNAGAESKREESTPLHEYLPYEVEKIGRHFCELFEFIASKGKIGWFNVGNYYYMQTPFHLFLKTCEIDKATLEMICKEQVDFAKVDRNGRGCLHYAIIGGNWNPEYLQILMDKGANVKGLTSSGETLLHFAVRHNVPLETFQFLLGKGLDIAAVQIHGETALDIAIETDDVRPELVSKLLIWRFEAGVRQSNKRQLPMLHLAIEYGTPDVVEHMLMAKDVSPNEPDQYGITPLWKAIGSIESLNPVEKAKLLVRHGAKTKFDPDNNGQTILHHAAKDVTFATAALKYCLEELGINVDSKDKDGKTPLLSIMFDSYLTKSQVEKAKILVLSGADVNAKPNPNVFVDEEMQLQTSLHLALYIDRFHSLDSLNFVNLLLEKGANVNEPSLAGWTPIQVASARSKNASFLRKLLKEFGANSAD